MQLPELALRGTIWLSLLAWVVGEWRRSQGGRGRGAWTLGALAALVHSTVAFDLRHGWSHAAAYADTARQNGTFVFAHGPIRWVGAAAVLAVGAAWYRRA